MTKKAEEWQELIRGVYSRAGPVADSDLQISSSECGGGGGGFGCEKKLFRPFRPQFVLDIRGVGGGSTSPGSTPEGPLQGLCHGRLIHFFKYCQLGVLVGESLYTLFASLTYAYHYLMTLIK